MHRYFYITWLIKIKENRKFNTTVRWRDGWVKKSYFLRIGRKKKSISLPFITKNVKEVINENKGQVVESKIYATEQIIEVILCYVGRPSVSTVIDKNTIKAAQVQYNHSSFEVMIFFFFDFFLGRRWQRVSSILFCWLYHPKTATKYSFTARLLSFVIKQFYFNKFLYYIQGVHEYWLLC